MSQNTSVKSRIAIVATVLVGVAAVGYGGFVAWMYHVTYASDADCKAAQAIVTEGGALTDAAAAKPWADSARTQKDKITHERLRTGVTKYITVVEQTLGGQKPKDDAKSKAFGDMFDACRDIEVKFPEPRA